MCTSWRWGLLLLDVMLLLVLRRVNQAKGKGLGGSRSETRLPHSLPATSP
jgi:hypothetical protein